MNLQALTLHLLGRDPSGALRTARLFEPRLVEVGHRSHRVLALDLLGFGDVQLVRVNSDYTDYIGVQSKSKISELPTETERSWATKEIGVGGSLDLEMADFKRASSAKELRPCPECPPGGSSLPACPAKQAYPVLSGSL